MTTTDVPCIVPETPFFCSWSGGKDCYHPSLQPGLLAGCSRPWGTAVHRHASQEGDRQRCRGACEVVSSQ